MSKQSEAAFEALADEVSEKAAAIDCAKQEYIEGLEALIDRLDDDRAAAEETADDAEQEEPEEEAEEER